MEEARPFGIERETPDRRIAFFPTVRSLIPTGRVALWAQTEFSRIIYLDVDVLIMRNIDHMAHFPADAFTPEVCSVPKCLPDKIPAGINVGVMVRFVNPTAILPPSPLPPSPLPPSPLPLTLPHPPALLYMVCR